MIVRVEYSAQLRAATGRLADELELAEACDLLSLLGQIAAVRGGDVATHLLTPDGRPQSGLLVVVNGAAVPAAQLIATVLRPGDVVTLLPPIAGG